MQLYDLCLAWNWEHDADFVRLLDLTCAARGLTLLSISTRNRDDILTRLARREVGFRALIDRASEADSTYLPLVDVARSLGARRLNPRELADRAYDKAAVHHAFLDDGIPTPRTIILPAYLDQRDLASLDLTHLGGPFAVKPALGGGGEGVIMEVSTLEQVQRARTQFPEQQYLLQEHVTPKSVDGLPAWFRVIYCLDEIFITFWDTITHVYTPVNDVGAVLRDCPAQGGHADSGGHVGPPQQTNPFHLASLREVTKRIASICHLDLFSTEIALTEDNRLLVVDYVNDPIDLRLQSKAKDGVPDFIVEDIAARLADEVTKNQAS